MRGSLIVPLILALAACGGGDPADQALGTPGAQDTTTTPPPTTPGDTIVPGGPDTSMVPPPDTATPPPSHEGVPFGPAHVPPERFLDFSGTLYTATNPDTLIQDLEKARLAGVRLLISFTGNEQYSRDENGFSIPKWEQRVDRFRGVDLTRYIEDGTIIGHFIMDEPQDASNWSGKRVTPAQIEEIAKYSKQVWPTLPTVIRSFTDYLKGYQYPDLDAIQVQYLNKWGSVDDFIAAHVQGAKSLGLALIGGLNVLNGGAPTSGIPGRRVGKYAMNADEIRSWGSQYLSDPYVCAFLMWEYDAEYLSRPDIQAALNDLSQVARSHPQKACRP
jgi:hypothetical protein